MTAMSDERLKYLRTWIDQDELLFPSSTKELLAEIDRLRAELASEKERFTNFLKETEGRYAKCDAEVAELRDSLRWAMDYLKQEDCEPLGVREPDWQTDGYCCLACDADASTSNSDIKHTDTCPWAKAKKLAESAT